MSSLHSLYIKLDTLKTIVSTLETKQATGIELTLSVNDEVNKFGQNLGAYVKQSKEEQDAKKPRYYVGNGKTFWTDGKIQVAPKQSQPSQHEQVETAVPIVDDLPF